jgi:hypothetical protein
MMNGQYDNDRSDGYPTPATTTGFVDFDGFMHRTWRGR